MSVLAVCGMCGCENRSSGDGDRTEYIYGDSIEEDHGGGPLGIRLGVPDSCDLTFDTGHSKLSEISLVDDDIQVANVDRAYTVSFDRMIRRGYRTWWRVYLTKTREYIAVMTATRI